MRDIACATSNSVCVQTCCVFIDFLMKLSSDGILSYSAWVCRDCPPSDFLFLYTQRGAWYPQHWRKGLLSRGAWWAGARCSRAFGIATRRLELLTFSSALTPQEVCRCELNSPDEQSQVNTDELRLNGEIHATGLFTQLKGLVLAPQR